MIDVLAHKMRLDPVEVRRRNLIPPFDNGHDVITGLKYDSGNYQGALDKALTHIGYDKLRAEQAAARAKGRLHRHRRLDLRRDLRPRAVAGRRRDRIPGRPLGKRDRPLPPERQGQRVHRRVAARAGRGDDVRADRGRRARRRRERREDRSRRHRQHADGLGHLRQPHDGGGRRGAGRGDAQDQGEGEAAGQPPARGRRRGHRLRRRQVLREGLARSPQDHPGHRADGQRRVEPAAGHGGGPRGVELLRSAELHLSVRRARRGRRSRSGDRPRAS